MGFFGWGNYGDELFLDVFAQYLDAQFDLRVMHDSLTKPYYTSSLSDVVDGTDAIIIGGGDLVTPWSLSELYWRDEYLDRPVFIAGVGVPTWRKPEAGVVDRLRAFFQHPNVEMVWARDDESASWIEHHLAPRVSVLSAPDLVCALRLPEPRPVSETPVLGVVTRKRPQPDDYSQLYKLCARAVEQGFVVRQLVLASQGLRRVELEIARSFDFPDTDVVSSDDPAELTAAIGGCTAVASMKFHGSLVATMYGEPAIVLVPTDKNRNFFRRIGRPDLLSQLGADDLPDRLDAVREPTNPDVVEELRRQTDQALTALRMAVGHATAAGRPPTPHARGPLGHRFSRLSRTKRL